MNVNEIMSILPHRFPLLLVDRVIEKTQNSIVAIKNVSANELFFLGHFPEYPIYPGVLIIEGLAQAAGLMLLEAGMKVVPLFLGIEKARFKSEVRPGDVIRYEVRLKETKLGVHIVDGEATVNGKIVATATLMLGVKKQ